MTEFGELCIHSFIRSPIHSFTHSSRGRHTPCASGSSVINSSALARIEQYVLWPCLSDQVPARITWGDFFFNADAQAPLQTQRRSLPMVVPTPVIFFKAPVGFLLREYTAVVSSPVSGQLGLWCPESILEELHPSLKCFSQKRHGPGRAFSISSGSNPGQPSAGLWGTP